MPQLILSNSERIAPAAVIVDDHKPVGTDVNFPDVLADLDVESLPDDVVEYGRVRVGETEESRTRLVAELEDMIYERGDVTPHRMDEKFLLRFLRARHFKLNATYKLIVNYYRFRENHPDYYTINPLDLSFIADLEVLSVLPYKEQTGRRILIYKLGNWNTNDFDMNEILKASLATLELGILEPMAQILGGVVIFDMNGFTLQHAYQITPKVVSTIFDLIVYSIPMKTYAIHIINESWVFETVFNLFKPLLGKRYNEMLFFHGKNMESLHKHIDPKYLPKEYGGVRPNYPYQHWFINLKNNAAVVKEMESLGYNIDSK
ncbi:alpha-tocopherol transfer protein-like [Rhopalosiphum padi]|uniref:alpha-tocopherol transfer protein-like n=1 Tax=Rhopalosiphum padi TaxID=40932 RepID=UPI00298E2A4A|nr:alpha-tocopherol transfer protein-like [Rhopalosiphum padi]